jgi:tetratricopeptide (TPR) repeat protein
VPIEVLFFNLRSEPTTRAELETRWGMVQLRGGRIRQALDHFDRAGLPAEPAVRYWLHLFRGQAYERDDRPADAMASYRLALEAVPQAQSAVFALAALLIEQHQPDEAAALVSSALAITTPPLDPWVYYQYPHFRLWPGVMTELRRVVRR